jgi:hypothetical protein
MFSKFSSIPSFPQHPTCSFSSNFHRQSPLSSKKISSNLAKPARNSPESKEIRNALIRSQAKRGKSRGVVWEEKNAENAQHKNAPLASKAITTNQSKAINKSMLTFKAEIGAASAQKCWKF